MSVNAIVAAALVGGVMVSAVLTVCVQHQRRSLFIELQRLERARDAMEVEWSQLQLEGSAWSNHDRIEGIARARLGLRVPRTDAIVLVTP